MFNKRGQFFQIGEFLEFFPGLGCGAAEINLPAFKVFTYTALCLNLYVAGFTSLALFKGKILIRIRAF
jgi:hypothetical protein